MLASNATTQPLPSMQYRRLGSTGLKVSAICLGMMSYGDPKWRDWVLPYEPSVPFVKRAIDLGINFFDTANTYSYGVSEEVTGRAIAECGLKREEAIIATKVFFQTSANPAPNTTGLSRKHIIASCEASLKRLGTDYIDLYQIHRWDNETPIEETLEALNDLVRSGKVRYIGCSSCFSWQFMKALTVSEKHGWAKFVSMQNHYNLVYREEEREMIPLCRDQGIGVIPWSPLARGFLAGNRKRGEPHSAQETARAKSDNYAHNMYFQDSDWDVVDRVKQVAAARKNGSPAEVSLAWLLSKPAVSSAIIGATKIEHLDSAVRSLAVKLTEDEIKTLESAYKPHPVLGHQ